MASNWDEQLLANSFRKDHTGRLVFLPFGGNKSAYYIDSPSDEQKTRPFSRMYFLSRALVQIVGNLSANLFALAVAFADPSTPLAHKIKVFVAIYLIGASLFEFLPLWLIGRLYRKSIPEICSSMPVAGPEEISQLARITSPLRRRILLIIVGLVILIAAIVMILITRANC
jgi:hypothetical protein